MGFSISRIIFERIFMNQISHIATWVQRFALFIVAPLIIMIRLLSWGKINAHKFCTGLLESGVTLDYDVVGLPKLGKVLFFTLESISALCLLIALWYFVLILSLYKKNQFFTKEVIMLLQKINVVMLLWAVYELFFDTIGSLAIALFKEPGHRYLKISISFNDIIHLFIALTLFMTLSLMKEAYKMKSDQDLVV